MKFIIFFNLHYPFFFFFFELKRATSFVSGKICCALIFSTLPSTQTFHVKVHLSLPKTTFITHRFPTQHQQGILKVMWPENFTHFRIKINYRKNKWSGRVSIPLPVAHVAAFGKWGGKWR